MSDLNTAVPGLAAAADAIAAGRLTSAALVAQCLDRIDRSEGRIRAWVRVDQAGARRAAVARDSGTTTGPLHGIPIAIKDIIDTADMPTECGSPLRSGHVPERNADCVARLIAAGAIVLGKTVTTEFAHLHPGPTANPWDIRRTPGGSSSGSAAAVAAGMVPAALGSQTGGSVIRPASFCGIFGFKSTIGRTDVTGVAELARSFDTVGWFGRSADDLPRLAHVLLVNPRFAPVDPPHQARIGVTMTPFAAAATPAAWSAIARAGDALTRAGHKVSAVDLPGSFTTLNQHHRAIVSTEIGRALAADWSQRRASFSMTLASFIDNGLNLPQGGYEQAQLGIGDARVEFDALMTNYDALLCPAATGEAPIGLGATGDPVLNSMWSALGAPSASLPAARGPSNLPIGIQFVGGRGRDEALLALVERVAAQLHIRTQRP